MNTRFIYTNRLIALLLIIQILFIGNIYSQKVKENTASESSAKTRSTVDLMNAITNNIMGTYELRDGEYLRGDWSDVQKSKPPRALYWSYPTGVCLLAMQRVYDVTGDVL